MGRFIFVNSDTTGCGFYRTFIPGTILYNSGYEVIFSQHLDESFLKPDDNVILQRCYSPKILSILKNNKHKIRFFYEIDDDLLHIYKGHQMYNFFLDKRKYIKKIIKSCNKIITTNDYLKKRYIHLNEDISIFPNFVYKTKFKAKSITNNPIRLLYTGTQSHTVDLMTIVRPLKKLSTEINLKFVLLGFKPPENIGIDIEYHPPVPPEKYYDKISDLNIDVAVAPLAELKFKKSKSNIKFLEYSALSIPAIIKDFGPYRDIPDNCAIKYKTQDDFLKGFKRLVRNRELYLSLLKNSNKFIQDFFSLKQAEEALKKIYSIRLDLSKSTYQKDFNRLLSKFKSSTRLSDIDIPFNNFFLYGFSETGRFFFSKYKNNILGIYDKDPKLVPKDFYFDIFKNKMPKNTPILITSRGYCIEIEKILFKLGYKNTFSIF